MLLNLFLIIISIIKHVSNEKQRNYSQNLRSESETDHAQLFLLEPKHERSLRNKDLNPIGNIDHNIGNIDHHFGTTDHHLGFADHHFETQTLDISYLEESDYTLGKKLKEQR